MSESDTLASGSGPSQRPAPIKALDSLCAASTIAHETIYELHRRLGLVSADSQECDQLLAESAQIATQEVPGAVAAARELAIRWRNESIVDPEAAQKTLAVLSVAVETCKPALRTLLNRQRTIAATLRSRLGTRALE